MKKIFTLLGLGITVSILFMASSPQEKAGPRANEYIVIAWNDLGMHCSNKDFSNMAILPPYNNQFSHVILRGSESSLPTVMGQGSGVHVTYEVPGNTFSGSPTVVSKTNFWQYATHLFGVTLPDNVGLTGLGLTGTMHDTVNYYEAIGIPVTPYQDNNLTTPDPYQLTLIKAWDAGNNLLAQTQNVIPVSNEISCVSSGCHSSEMSILNAHESVSGFNIANKPILCANCHADNALGMPGSGGAPPFSQAIHQAHGNKTNDCYKCHPGPITQCFRDTMHMGGMVCQDCHGSVSNVGNTIAAGRQPWLQEPSCGATTCHGANFAENPGKLFKQSKGHGGLFCSTCHGSPHAIFTSENPRDNLQNITLQGYAGILKKCEVCHGYVPAAPGPHGYNPVGIRPVSNIIPEKSEVLQNYPNPCSFMTNIPFRISKAGMVDLSVYNLQGEKVKNLISNRLEAGEYKAELYASKLPPGTYICALYVNGAGDLKKIVVVK